MLQPRYSKKSQGENAVAKMLWFGVVLATAGSTKNMTTPHESRAKKIAQKMCQALNSMGFDYPTFVAEVMRERRTIQQNVFRAILALIGEWADKEPHEYDLRNEATVYACKKMMAALEHEDKCLPKY